MAAQKASEAEPEMQVASGAFLHRKASSGFKERRDLIEVVLLEASGGGGAQDVIELYADNGTEVREWGSGRRSLGCRPCRNVGCRRSKGGWCKESVRS